MEIENAFECAKIVDMSARFYHSGSGVATSGPTYQQFLHYQKHFQFPSHFHSIFHFKCLNTLLTCYFKQSVNKVPKCRIEFSHF